MSKYIVEITGRYRKLITVEAESRDDAWDAAEEALLEFDAPEHVEDMEFNIAGESNEDELMEEIIGTDTLEKYEQVKEKLLDSKSDLPDNAYHMLVVMFDMVGKSHRW